MTGRCLSVVPASGEQPITIQHMSTAPSRNASALVTAGLILLGVVLLLVGIVYFAEPAKSLPSFFPGHAAGSAHHHTKHGLAALIVGAVAIGGAWMSTGKKRTE